MDLTLLHSELIIKTSVASSGCLFSLFFFHLLFSTPLFVLSQGARLNENLLSISANASQKGDEACYHYQGGARLSMKEFDQSKSANGSFDVSSPSRETSNGTTKSPTPTDARASDDLEGEEYTSSSVSVSAIVFSCVAFIGILGLGLTLFEAFKHSKKERDPVSEKSFVSSCLSSTRPG